MRRKLVILALSFACSPEASEPTDSALQGPCLDVDLSSVRFGRARLAADAVDRSVVIRNACEGELTVEPAVLEQDGSAFDVFEIEVTALGPGEQLTLPILFSPTVPGPAAARLNITSNAGRRVIELQGTGRGAQVVIEPAALSFGEVPVGCAEDRTILVRNAGNEPVDVSEIVLTGSSDASLLAVPNLPLFLAPDATIEVRLGYTASESQVLTSTLTVRSDDPVRPTVDLAVRGLGITGPTHTETFENATAPQLDIVVTVDRSGRMPERLPAWLDAVPALFSGLRAAGVDSHLTVIVADDGCPVANPAFIQRSSDVSAAAEHFAALVDVDFVRAKSGLDEERGFRLADRALEQTVESACLDGFRRPDASIATVHISDEDEQSGIGWQGYVDGLAEWTDDPGHVSVHAIAGDFPSGCGFASPGDEYYYASVLSGGSFHSVCAADRAAVFDDLAASLSKPRLSFRLMHPAMPDTLRVTVDGSPWTSGWSYDLETGAIVLEASSAPSATSDLEVTYAERLDCR